MFSLEKDTSFMFTELGMDPNDAGVLYEYNSFVETIISLGRKVPSTYLLNDLPFH